MVYWSQEIDDGIFQAIHPNLGAFNEAGNVCYSQCMYFRVPESDSLTIATTMSKQ